MTSLKKLVQLIDKNGVLNAIVESVCDTLGFKMDDDVATFPIEKLEYLLDTLVEHEQYEDNKAAISAFTQKLHLEMESTLTIKRIAKPILEAKSTSEEISDSPMKLFSVQLDPLTEDLIEDDYGNEFLAHHVRKYAAQINAIHPGQKIKIYGTPSAVCFKVISTPEYRQSCYEHLLNTENHTSEHAVILAKLFSHLFSVKRCIKDTFGEAVTQKNFAALVLLFQNPQYQKKAKEQLRNLYDNEQNGFYITATIKNLIVAFQMEEFIKTEFNATNNFQASSSIVPGGIYKSLNFLEPDQEWHPGITRPYTDRINMQITGLLTTEAEATEMIARAIYRLAHLPEVLMGKIPYTPLHLPTQYRNESLALTEACSMSLKGGEVVWKHGSEQTKESKQVTGMPPFGVYRPLANDTHIGSIMHNVTEEAKKQGYELSQLAEEQMALDGICYLHEAALKKFLLQKYNNHVACKHEVKEYRQQDIVIKSTITVVEQPETKQIPLLIPVIDRSGSMYSKFNMSRKEIEDEKSIKTYMDYAKEALIDTIKKNKGLGIAMGYKPLAFDDRAEWVVKDELSMTAEDALEQASRALSSIKPRGGTYTLTAFRTALKNIPKGRLVHILLITDGNSNEPNVPLDQYHAEAEKIYKEEVLDKGLDPKLLSCSAYFMSEYGFEAARPQLEAIISPFVLRNRGGSNVVYPVRPDRLAGQIGASNICQGSGGFDLAAQMPKGKKVELGTFSTLTPQVSYTTIPKEHLTKKESVFHYINNGKVTLKTVLPEGNYRAMTDKEITEYELQLIIHEAKRIKPDAFASTETIIHPQTQEMFANLINSVRMELPAGAAKFASDYCLVPGKTPTKAALIAVGLLDEPPAVAISEEVARNVRTTYLPRSSEGNNGEVVYVIDEATSQKIRDSNFPKIEKVLVTKSMHSLASLSASAQHADHKGDYKGDYKTETKQTVATTSSSETSKPSRAEIKAVLTHSSIIAELANMEETRPVNTALVDKAVDAIIKLNVEHIEKYAAAENRYQKKLAEYNAFNGTDNAKEHLNQQVVALAADMDNLTKQKDRAIETLLNIGNLEVIYNYQENFLLHMTGKLFPDTKPIIEAMLDAFNISIKPSHSLALRPVMQERPEAKVAIFPSKDRELIVSDYGSSINLVIKFGAIKREFFLILTEEKNIDDFRRVTDFESAVKFIAERFNTSLRTHYFYDLLADPIAKIAKLINEKITPPKEKERISTQALVAYYRNRTVFFQTPATTSTASTSMQPGVGLERKG